MTLNKKEIQSRFICAKCHNHGCAVEEVAVAGGALSRVLPVPTDRFLAVSCSLCGFTEFYNLSIPVASEEPETSRKRALTESTETA